MDAGPIFDPQYLPLVLGTLVGFGLLAALLLVPVYRFLERERKVSEQWTPEQLAKRMRDRRTSRNGTDAEDHSEEAEGTSEAP